MPYIEHQYGKTYYQSRSSRRSGGLPLVCLHGGPGGHSRNMKDLFQLADERRVFIYDQIGGGRSSTTTRARWRITTFVNELKYLVKAWGLERFHLFGGSWGATLALEYYLAPARKNNGVRSLIFQSPLFSAADWHEDAGRLIKKLPARQRKVIDYCHEIGATDSKIYADAMQTYYARHVCRNKTSAKKAAAINNPNGNRIYEYMWGASEFHATGSLKDYDKTGKLSTIDCPALLVCGEYDEARPATVRRYHRMISSADFSLIKGASHAILAEKPRLLIDRIRRFTRQHDG